MNVKKLLGSIFSSSHVHAALGIAATTLTQAVATAAQTDNPIGKAALAAAQAVESTTSTSAEKKSTVVAAILPLVAEVATKGGLTVLAADAETFAGMVVEAVVAQLKPTSVLSLAAVLLKQLG